MKTGKIGRKEIVQIFFVFLSFIMMVLVSYIFVSRIVNKHIFSNAKEAINTAEVTIHSDIREAELALIHAELMIQAWVEEGMSLDAIRSYLSLITNNLNAEGFRIPGFVDMYGYVHNDFVSGMGNAPPEAQSQKHRHLYVASQLAKDHIGLSSPYVDEHTGKYVISLVKNLQTDDGENYGTIVMDIDFSILSKYIAAIYFIEGGYGMLCDENFNFIVHPDSAYVGICMDNISSGHEKIAKKLRDAPGKTISERMLNVAGVPVIVIFRQIYNGWYLGMATPVSNYYQDVRTMAVVLSTLGLILAVILCAILIQLSLSKTRSDEENVAKSSFLARMSHDIRTPLNSILGIAEVIHQKSDSDEIQEYIDIVRQSGNNLLAIINDILDISKIESEQLQIECREYRLASVINDMVNIARSQISKKSLDFFVSVDGAIPATLFGDDMRLRQILTNLLSNAIKYTPNGFVSLNVSMERLGDACIRLIFEVQDSGIGIKPEDQQLLFHEFSRVDTKSTRGIEGTGLGLMITRLLCRAMEGDVTVSSEYGKGSTFRVVITQAFTDDSPIAQVIEPEKKRVLFYDWREMHMRHLDNLFKNLGVNNAKSALDFKEFFSDLEHGDYDFAFVSSKYAMDCINALGKRNTPLQLVTMVEPKEMSVYREVTKILLPIYSVTMANVLNDTNEGVLLQEKTFKNSFTAPSARILIVDDISTNLRVAQELMVSYQMEICTCLNGIDALEMVTSNRFDIIFMDHMMPGMDGIETTDRIRAKESADGYYQKLPIVALTANALSGQQELFLQHGFSDFLAKPIDTNKLNAVLEKWLPAEKRQEVSELHAEVLADENKLAAIPGIDMETGLHHSGGKTAVFMSILADFCHDVESRMPQINEALAQGDMQLYVTLVHALKGAARSVGAIETGELAAWLEKNAEADMLLAKDKTVELQDNVLNLIGNIKNAQERYEAENSQEHVELSAAQLDALKNDLAAMNIEAVNKALMDFSSLPLEEEDKAKISEVEQYILLFEYENAIEKINELFSL